MNYFWKVNIYELQTILYWILGVLILNIGEWRWVGWLTIGYGWFIFLYALRFAAKHHKEILTAFNNNKT